MCDDDLPILRAAEIKLSRAGYRITLCGDGQEALEAIHRERPDLLLTDCQLPRLGGLELIQRLREDEATRDLPVLMLTGKGFELPVEELRDKWGVLAVIPKPFSPREVLKLIDGVFAAGAV
jgi:DNA-binding response OmpR family regulator